MVQGAGFSVQGLGFREGSGFGVRGRSFVAGIFVEKLTVDTL